MNLVVCISEKLTFQLVLKWMFIAYTWMMACLVALFLVYPTLRFGFDRGAQGIKEYIQHIGGLLLLWPFSIYLYFVSLAGIFCIFLISWYRLYKITGKKRGFTALLKDKQSLHNAIRYILLLPFKICFYFMSLVGTLYLFLILTNR